MPHADLSIASLILGASLLVKFVMMVLLLASLASWTLIFVKRRELGMAKREARRFEDQFLRADDLTALFNAVAKRAKGLRGLERIFESGFREYARLRAREDIEQHGILEGTQRAMRIAIARQSRSSRRTCLRSPRLVR